MSLVGPRPHANAHNEQYRTQIDGYMLRHKVKPGITGLAQVSGYRGETETLEKMAATRRLRPPVHPRVVVLDGPEDSVQDAAGGRRSGMRTECRCRQTRTDDCCSDAPLRLEDLRAFRIEVSGREAVVELQVGVGVALVQSGGWPSASGHRYAS